jgi:hypothetical protein
VLEQVVQGVFESTGKKLAGKIYGQAGGSCNRGT